MASVQRRERPKAIKVTEAAAARIREMMEGAEDGVIGIRVGVRARGCSGLSYTIDYARDVQKLEEVVEDKGVRVLIDPKAMMYILGSEMDWQEDRFNSTFVFNNPNAKGACGCGESFHV